MSFWRSIGSTNIIVDGNGSPINCNECPCDITPGDTCEGSTRVSVGVTYGPFQINAVESHWFFVEDFAGGNISLTYNFISGTPDAADSYAIYSDCETLVEQASADTDGCIDVNVIGGDVFFNVRADVSNFEYSITIEEGECP